MTIIQVLVVIIIGPYVVYEGLRFYRAHEMCKQRAQDATEMWSSPQCTWLRDRYGPDQRVICDKASVEREQSPLACACETMWTGGAIYRAWSTVEQSHVSLTIVVVACLLMMLHLTANQFSRWRDRSQQERIFREYVRPLQSNAYPPQLPYLVEAQAYRPQQQRLQAKEMIR